MLEIKQLPNNGRREEPYYEITKDGFSFLVMGYTGAKAAEFNAANFGVISYLDTMNRKQLAYEITKDGFKQFC